MPAVATGAMAPDPDRDPFDVMVALLRVWSILPKESLAMLAKAAKPELTDLQISQLVGRSPRQLRRWTGYARLTGNRADLRDGRRYRGFSDPDTPDA